MQTRKPYYFNAWSLIGKLSLLIICGILFACSRQNDTKQFLSPENQIQISERAININTAPAAELERIPHIGAKKALEIIEYRERFGVFRRTEHLMLVRGISDGRFREIRHLIRVE